MMKPIVGWSIMSVCLMLTACNTPRYMYSPSAQNVPVLLKKGDTKLAANYSSHLSGDPFSSNYSDGTEKTVHGMDLQGAIAITDHFAIQAQYFYRTERNYSGTGGNYVDSLGVNYRRHLTEAGIGYYQSIHSRDKVMFQLFGGVGFGTFSFIDKGKDVNNIFYTRSHEADVLKIYFQPAFQFRIRDNFALAISTRLSFLKYNDIKTSYSNSELINFQLERLGMTTHSFWEPAFTNTFGFKSWPWLKFEYQFGTSFRISEALIDYRSFNFAAGILLDLPKMFRPAANNEKN